MSATFDTTTKTAYDAATTAAARATAIVASLSSGGSPQGAVLVKVYNGASPDVEMGSGTMAAPWATASGGTVVIGEVSSFTVGTTGTPDANWYIKFRTLDGTRWARASFGLSGSTQDFTWSLATFSAGQTGTIGTATIVCTGNAAPVFTAAPAIASIAATGGTIQFTATDPDGGAILYSLTTTRNGITISSTTGLVTVTAAAAATSGNIVVQASDGILTTTTTCAVTVASGETAAPIDYPRIAAGQIGGFGTTWDAARWNTVAKYHIAFLGGNRWWSAGGYNGSTLATYLKTANPDILLFKYTNLPETYYNDSAWSVVWNKLAAEDGAGGNGDWWLRTAAGAQIVGYSSTQRRVNFTSLVTADANGWRWPQWFARFWYLSAGELSGLTGQGIKDGPYDGFYEDNQYIDRAFTASGDYNEDGVDESGTSAYVVNLVVEGHVAFHDACAAIAPSLLFAANQSAYLHPTEGTYDSRLTAINDCGWQEDQSKMDYYFGFSTMMEKYRDGLSWLSGPKYGIFNAHLFRYTGWLSWTEERTNRYFLCATLLDDGYYMPTTTDNGYSRAVWCDEFDYNLGQPLETAAGAVQTSAWSLGVFRREFDNGLVLLNPRGNGNRTVTLTSAGTGYEWRRLNTTAWASGTVLTNGSINTGAAQGSSLTINDGTGLILRRVAT